MQELLPMWRSLLIGLLALCSTACSPQSHSTVKSDAPSGLVDLPAPTIDLSPLAIPTSVPLIPWQTPAPRTEVSAPFAPAFLKGNDIFRGEREAWISNAVTEASGLNHFRPLEDPFVRNYVEMVGQSLVPYSHEPKKQYTFTVLNFYLPNAFSVGNGRIFITTGMLERLRNEDELAGVLAHEIGHDNFHHIGRTMTRELFWMNGTHEIETEAQTLQEVHTLFDRYRESPFAEIAERLSGIGRMDETAADKAAFYNLYRAGYNPLAFTEVFTRQAKAEEKELIEETTVLYPLVRTLALVLDSHPPGGFRWLAVHWESNFVDMSGTQPPRSTDAFIAMRGELTRLRQDALAEARKRRAGRVSSQQPNHPK